MTANGPGAAPRATETGPHDLRAAKAALRARALAARADTTPAALQYADAARLPLLLAACEGHRAVACYASIDPEPDTWGLVDALAAAGVRVLLPVLKGHREPAWGWYAGRTSLVPGWHGIPEPAGRPLSAPALAQVSLVWVSALLAAPDGVRLGTGGGWWDRALRHRMPGALVGAVVNEREVVPALPRDAWDVPVDLLVSEVRTRTCRQPRATGHREE